MDTNVLLVIYVIRLNVYEQVVDTRDEHSATKFTVSPDNRCSRRKVLARRLCPVGGAEV